MNLLEVTDLKVHYPLRHRFWGQPDRYVRAVDGVTFAIKPGETLGLVGESGCGKSTLGRAVLRLLKPTAGRVLFRGEDLGSLSASRLRTLRRRMQIVFQDPYGSLDPRLTIEDTVGEALDIHRLATGRKERAQKVAELLQTVGIEPAASRRYPHEFSGGQRQRVSIARALAVQPEFVVFDEPVSALDVSVQAQILNLLMQLREERGIASLFIAHDLAVVEHVSHRVMVMYLGRIVEVGRAEEVTQDPIHPYTQTLLAAVPVVPAAEGGQYRGPQEIGPPGKKGDGDSQELVPAGPRHPEAAPSGCPFESRCPVAEPRCKSESPALAEISPGHFVACHLAGKPDLKAGNLETKA